jgi:LmbE family N-acetylglucosaminyl deacetylase
MPERQQEVLVLSPHPDDETFGCGGTIRMLTERGVAVDVAFLTRGEMGVEGYSPTAQATREMAETRTHEAKAACDVLGIRQLTFLQGHDMQLQSEPGHVAAIVELLRSRPYQRVFCPWPHDSHADHGATFRLLREAAQHNGASLSFWLYEVWKPLPANTFVPIDLTIEFKRQAIDQYKSQLAQLNYREGMLGLSAYRSLFCPPSKFAEAFLVCDFGELLSLS